MTTTTPTHTFREVAYQLPRTHDDSPVTPNPEYAGLFPKRTK